MIDQLEKNRLVICIDNKGNEASLERWKVYQCIQDEGAEKHNELRVIDEEGEDYLYPADLFSSVSLEPSIAETFIMQNLRASRSAHVM